MISELGVTDEEFGRAVGAFFFAYALMQVPAGWLADRLGARLMLTIYVVAWSLTTIMLGFVNSLAAIVSVRILLGIAQAGAYPTAASALGRWIPANERARCNSAVATGGRLGGLIAFALTPILMGGVGTLIGWKTGQWRVVFVGYGALGLLWAFAFYRWFRDTPQLHPRCNEAETDLIAGIDESGKPSGPPPESFLQIFTSGNIWFLCAINFLINIGWIFLATWMPSYLEKHYTTELEANFSSVKTAAGVLTAFTALAGMTGNMLGGWWADVLVRRFGLRRGRIIPGITSGCLACAVYALAMFTDNLWLFVLEMAAIYFLTDLAIGSLWAVYQDIASKNVAAALAFPNMCGNLGAAGCAWAIGYLAGKDQWNIVFLISAGSFLLAAVCWAFVRADRPLAGDSSHDQ